MPRITVLQGSGKGKTFDIHDGATIGRMAANDIPLAGDRISRRHAQIMMEGECFTITDLGSRNGVMVNGRKTARTVLMPGDRIEIGDSLLSFEMDDVHDSPTQEIELGDEREGDTPYRLPSGEPVLFSEDAAAVTEFFRGGAKDYAGKDGKPDAKLLLPELREANRRLKALHDVSDAIHDTFDLHDLMHKILNLVLDIFEAERAVILLHDPANGKLRPAAARNRQKTTARLAVSQTVVDYVAKRMRSVISADALADPRFDPSDSIAVQNIRSVMCVPLASKENSQGVLYVDNRNGLSRFQKDDLRLLTIIARQAATAIENARSYSNLREEREELKRQVSEKFRIVGESPKLKAVLDEAMQVAHVDTTVLITGETGSGKELVARALHEESPRCNGPFVVVNCASVPESLLESELFGHEKGAFTGAYRTRVGKFELADGGTLFLDEVGETSPAVQTKLLRAVEQKEFHRVGGTKSITVDSRIVTATNRNLEQMVKAGTFREDLYYRLAVMTLTLPPLRERREDIPPLAEYFLAFLAKDIGRRTPELSSEALELLVAYPWPGNIRELRNAMERAILLNRSGIIKPDDLPPALQGTQTPPIMAPGAVCFPMSKAIEVAERQAIEEAMKLSEGIKTKAANLLGISRPTLDKKLQQYGSHTVDGE